MEKSAMWEKFYLKFALVALGIVIGVVLVVVVPPSSYIPVFLTTGSHQVQNPECTQHLAALPTINLLAGTNPYTLCWNTMGSPTADWKFDLYLKSNGQAAGCSSGSGFTAVPPDPANVQCTTNLSPSTEYKGILQYHNRGNPTTMTDTHYYKTPP